jgi:hypothetical protein
MKNHPKIILHRMQRMAWHILFFLKSLKSLEEFRKNFHIKIPPKSPCTNFQGLGIFKNPIFISKRIFLQISAQSAQQSAGPSGLLTDMAHSTSFLLLPTEQSKPPPPPAGLTPNTSCAMVRPQR